MMNAGQIHPAPNSSSTKVLNFSASLAIFTTGLQTLNTAISVAVVVVVVNVRTIAYTCAVDCLRCRQA